MMGIGRKPYHSSAAFIVCLCVLSASATGAKDSPEPAIEHDSYLESPAQRADALAAPPLLFDRLPQWFNVGGLISAGASERLLSEVDLRLQFRPPRFGRFGVELWTDGTTTNREPVARAHRLGSGARLRLDVANGEVWAGGSGGDAWDGETWNEFTSVGGGWDIRAGHLSANLAIKGNHCSRAYSRVSYVRRGEARDSMGTWMEQVVQRGTEKLSYTDAEMDVSWTHGKLEVGVLGGLRLSASASAGSKSWLQVRNSYWFTESLALVLQGGRRPALPEMGLPGESFFAVGADIRFPGRSDRMKSRTSSTTASNGSIRVHSLFSITRLAAGTCRITMVVPGARTVLVSGDFSNWRALAMTKMASDTWQAEVAVSPGAYRVSVSIDGGPWQAPPGLAAQEDEFGQTAGMMFIR